MRHRVSIIDLGFIGAAVLVVLYIAFEIDIFLTEDTTSEEALRFELNELLLTGTVLTLGLLTFAFRRYRDQKREIARRTAAEHKARELAYQDPLTGLANRRQFDEALRRAIGSPPEAGYNHGLFLLDLNGFKQVNDSYGHGIGDEVLIVTAQRLMASVRAGDLVARLGGDEFVVLARNLLGAEAAANVALHMLAALEDPVATGGSQHRIGAGIGIALVPADAVEAGEALRKADVALYRAKAERRPAFRFFEAAMDGQLKERQQLEEALKRALDADLIEPVFRPSFDLESGAVTGFEAVPAWRSETGEPVPPERFLPIAEETGLIHRLGRRVLERACAVAAGWPDTVRLSMDVLPGQIRDRRLGATILDVLAKAGFDPRRLEIEIAESTIVQDLEAAKTALAPLREAGVSIALDNFGTGYSNLYHIREFRIDKVKIARRLVENLGEEETDRMVRALAGLGQGLGLTVSADGVTDAEEDRLLRDSGVRESQGNGDLVRAEDTGRLAALARRVEQPISPLVGEMPGRAEGGNVEHPTSTRAQ